MPSNWSSLDSATRHKPISVKSYIAIAYTTSVPLVRDKRTYSLIDQFPNLLLWAAPVCVVMGSRTSVHALVSNASRGGVD